MKSVVSFVIGMVVVVALAVACSTAKREDVAAGHVDYKKLCSQCHTLDRVEDAHKSMSKGEMRGIVEKMSKKDHSNIDPNDIDFIIEQIY